MFRRSLSVGVESLLGGFDVVSSTSRGANESRTSPSMLELPERPMTSALCCATLPMVDSARIGVSDVAWGLS
jgi:hypothetical protein